MIKWLSLPLAIVTFLVVAAVFTDEAEGIALSGYFDDDNGSTFEGDIDAIAAAGITKGCNPPTNNHFCPNDDVTRGEMAAFLRRALGLPIPNVDFFTDDEQSTFEGDINAIAAAGITKGCNPPTNNHFCPNNDVTRGEMAAFLRRALELPSTATDYFADDTGSVFQGDINAIAAAGITKGCNPPTNNHFCPNNDVTRGEMAAFLRRALDLPSPIETIPVGQHNAMSCSKDGQRCSLTVDLSASRLYRVQEGLFQVAPASSQETNEFNASNTLFDLRLDGAALSIDELSQQSGGGVVERRWRHDMQFATGTHTLVGRWRWNGTVLQTNTITIRASG